MTYTHSLWNSLHHTTNYFTFFSVLDYFTRIPSTSINSMLTSRNKSKYGWTGSSKPASMSDLWVRKFSIINSCLSQSSWHLSTSPSSHHSNGDWATRDWGLYLVPPDVHTHLLPVFQPSLWRCSPFREMPTARPRPNLLILKHHECFPVIKSSVPTTLSTSNRFDVTVKQSFENSGWPVKDCLSNFHILINPIWNETYTQNMRFLWKYLFYGLFNALRTYKIYWW